MEDATLGPLIERHRRELRAHCYRMLGAGPDADDATQDALLRAWQGREGLASPDALRAWLYRIATNVCLDIVARRGPRVLPHLAFPPAEAGALPRPFLEEAIWIGPLPDALAPGEQPGAAPDAASSEAHAPPDALYSRAEGVALAFVAALQHLPARQRAVLLLRDVVGLSAREAAEALEMTPAAVEAALQRARGTLAERRLAGRGFDGPPSAPTDAATRALLERYVGAWHARDPAALVALLAEDASFVMPPTPVWFHGREAVGAFVAARLAEHAFRLFPTRANGLPAFALYRAHPEGGYVAHGVQLVELRGAEIAAIHTFLAVKDDRSFRLFGLPTRLDEENGGQPISIV
jgi:RNA polymerase sigma-70 factor, ECF subfamily